MRLASLYGPDAIAQSPRATRFTTDADVRVVVGLAPLTRAIAEIERLPDNARTPGVAASYDEITDMVSPAVGPETAMRRVRGVLWKMEDRSDTGCRLTAPAKEAPAKLGRDPRAEGGRHLGARGRAPDAAAPGRRDDRRHRNRRPAARARAAAQLGDAVGCRPVRRRQAVLRHLPAGAPGEPADGAAQPDRSGRAIRHRAAWSSSTPATRATSSASRRRSSASRAGRGRCFRRCASSRPDPAGQPTRTPRAVGMPRWRPTRIGIESAPSKRTADRTHPAVAETTATERRAACPSRRLARLHSK